MRLRYLTLAIAIVVGMAYTANAGTVKVFGDVDDSGKVAGENAKFRKLDGGEFKIEVINAGTTSIITNLPADNIGARPNGAAKYFQTFCVETDENVSLGSSYSFAEPVDAVARAGGANTNAGDPISRHTAYLYEQFRLGTLSGYDYTSGSGREDDARDLQLVIWALENEINVSVGAESGAAAVKALLSSAQAKGWVDAAFAAVAAGYQNTRVRVLNLGNYNQDMLVLVPTPTASLAGMGLLAGMAGVGYLRRRSRSESL